MSLFDSISEVSDKAVDSGKNYIEISKSYYKLKVFKIVTKASTKILKILIVGGLCFMSFLFLLVSGTIWLGNELQNFALAFLIVAGVLLILSIVLYLIRNSIDSFVIKKTAKDFFEAEYEKTV